MTSPAEGGTERQVVRALGSIGAATLASRILGFVRDAVVALAFGAGPVTDAFFVAFRIPNILRRLLAEGALSTAMIPVFSDYAATRPRDEFVRMLRAVSGTALAALVVTTVLGVILSPWLLRAIAPGFTSDPAQESLAVLLTRVMFPYLLLVGLSALVMGALNAHGRFFAAALGPAVLNVGMIAGVFVLASRVDPAILALAIGVLVGGVGQLAVQLPSLRACGLLAPPVWEPGHPAVRRVARLLVPAVFGLAAVQVMVLVNTVLASLLPSGSISYLYYADRVMEFPLGVFGVALASASLPAMSRLAAAGDTAGVAATLGFALRLSVFVSLPATVGLVILSEPIIRVLFERGLFTAADTAATAYALVWYSVGLTGFAGARIVAQAFYAVGQPGTAVRLGIMAIAVNVVSALALMTPMAHAGLALASSIGAFANLAGLVWVARRRFGPIGGRAFAASTARVLVGCVPLAAWCLLARWLIPAAGGAAPTAVWVAAAVTGGAVLFIGVSGAVGSPELAVLSRALPWRRSR
ncbi:MAG TPA: murein biosynthesis integral membrane protein MurJ [Candidatus Limnocylindria bacterium]|nr:murein biosynthesis integral membrane protein MurJ [Candidatus Limnocylindria bacterium]